MVELSDNVRALLEGRDLDRRPRRALPDGPDPRLGVETVAGDAALEIMERMSLRYTGEPFPVRSGIALLVEPEQVFELQLPFEHAPA